MDQAFIRAFLAKNSKLTEELFKAQQDQQKKGFKMRQTTGSMTIDFQGLLQEQVIRERAK